MHISDRVYKNPDIRYKLDVSVALSWTEVSGVEEPIAVRFTHDFGGYTGKFVPRTILLQMSPAEARHWGEQLIKAAESFPDVAHLT